MFTGLWTPRNLDHPALPSGALCRSAESNLAWRLVDKRAATAFQHGANDFVWAIQRASEPDTGRSLKKHQAVVRASAFWVTVRVGRFGKRLRLHLPHIAPAPSTSKLSPSHIIPNANLPSLLLIVPGSPVNPSVSDIAVAFIILFFLLVRICLKMAHTNPRHHNLQHPAYLLPVTGFG